MSILTDARKAVIESMSNYVGLKAFLDIKWKEFWDEPLVFESDLSFWQLLYENDYGEFLYKNRGRPVILRNFKVTSWLPFIPGLYYKRNVIDKVRIQETILRREKALVIYDIHTKTDFVVNGFANIRFDIIKENEDLLLLNAFSSYNSCMGIPILVRDRDINLNNIDDADNRLQFEVHGILDYYNSYHPKFQFSPFVYKVPIIKALHKFALVERGNHYNDSDASAWALVEIWDKKIQQTCCVFASFSLGDTESRKNANNFIKDYIRREYNTTKYTIITDYDEVSPNLGADYNIRDINTNELLILKFRDIKQKYNL